MWSFYRETLADLVAYDKKQAGELLKTLDAYFNHLGNLRATSDALHVHRNTLLYRLERIEQISKLDLSNAEAYFSLWLALQAHRVLSSAESE
jgi:purine catabolism regulator